MKNKSLCIIMVLICIITLNGCGFNESEQYFMIAEQTAVDYALQDAQLSEENITDLIIERQTKQNLNYYFIRFNDRQLSYEYSIRCEDGFLIGRYTTLLDDTQNKAEISYDDAGIMSLKDAKKIVLNEVGLDFSQATFTEEEIELEMGIYLYSFEFIFDTTIYKYDLNAKTGEVLNFNIKSIY